MGHHSDIEDDRMSIMSDASYEEVEAANCTQRLGGLMFRLILSLIVVGACAGALVWSFIDGEAEVPVESDHEAGVNFTIFANQYSTAHGKYEVVYRLPDSEDTGRLSEPEEHTSFWYQDDDNSSLAHKIDPTSTIYAFEDHAYYVTTKKDGTVEKCDYTRTMNYYKYIEQCGLVNLRRQHSEIEKTNRHAKVFIYEGDPDDVKNDPSRQAFLITTYEDAKTGVLLGFDTYYSNSVDRVYERSYWYDAMKAGAPDPKLFDPPKECTPFEASRESLAKAQMRSYKYAPTYHRSHRMNH